MRHVFNFILTRHFLTRHASKPIDHSRSYLPPSKVSRSSSSNKFSKINLLAYFSACPCLLLSTTTLSKGFFWLNDKLCVKSQSNVEYYWGILTWYFMILLRFDTFYKATRDMVEFAWKNLFRLVVVKWNWNHGLKWVGRFLTHSVLSSARQNLVKSVALLCVLFTITP